MAEMKPFEVIMKISPIAGLNGKTGEVVFRSERQQNLVRCKDCKLNGDWTCLANCGADEILEMDDDDFCSWGERRDDEI